jgi:2-amino-4-hydroxy-6-hydroxymethyldihydropteridine diphosphokinase
MDVVVGLGANLGDRLATLASAVRSLESAGRLTAVSKLYETAPIGPPQPGYLNAAALLDTALEPRRLLESLLDIERRHGRVRAEKWGPRTLDLDILWIRGTVVHDPALTVPHPHLHERLFALLPLLDVAPDAVHPVTSEPLRTWVAALPAEEGIRISADGDWARVFDARKAEFEPR